MSDKLYEKGRVKLTVEELEMHKGNALFCLRQFHQEDTLKVVEKLFIDAIGKAELKTLNQG